MIEFQFSFPQSLWVAVGTTPDLSFKTEMYDERSFQALGKEYLVTQMWVAKRWGAGGSNEIVIDVTNAAVASKAWNEVPL